MKALTLWQPWASLIAAGAKRYETRGWTTSYRGPIAIHAAARFTRTERACCFLEPFRAALYAAGFRTLDDLPRGLVIAVADLVDVLPTSAPQLRNLPVRELEFGDFSADRWAWRLDHVRRLDQPVPARGAQRLWEVTL